MQKVYLPLKFLFIMVGGNGTAARAAEATYCFRTSDLHVCVNTTMKKVVVALHEKHMTMPFQISFSYHQIFIFYYHNYLLR